VLLMLSLLMLSLPGGYWPWYVIMAGFALVAVVGGPGRYRVMGAIALVLSVVLIVMDISAGRKFEKQRRQIRDEAVPHQALNTEH